MSDEQTNEENAWFSELVETGRLVEIEFDYVQPGYRWPVCPNQKYSDEIADYVHGYICDIYDAIFFNLRFIDEANLEIVVPEQWLSPSVDTNIYGDLPSFDFYDIQEYLEENLGIEFESSRVDIFLSNFNFALKMIEGVATFEWGKIELHFDEKSRDNISFELMLINKIKNLTEQKIIEIFSKGFKEEFGKEEWEVKIENNELTEGFFLTREYSFRVKF